MRRVNIVIRENQRKRRYFSSFLPRKYSSLFRTSVANRLSGAQGWSTKKMQEETAMKERKRLMAKVEPLVRERLQKEFSREFQASWFADSSMTEGNSTQDLTISSFKTLLALNGFKKVVKPSGNTYRLYLAEGVVATPPMQLSFNAKAIPFASGYQEFAQNMDIDNVGVFGDVHNHLVSATQGNKSTERLFAQPLERSHLHPDDAEFKVNNNNTDHTANPISPFPEFVQEDVTIYRVAETSAARFLDTTYSRWTRFVQRRFVRPIKDAKYRTRLVIKSANAMQAKFHEILEKSIAERIWEELTRELSNIHDRYERHSKKTQKITDTIKSNSVVASRNPSMSTEQIASAAPKLAPKREPNESESDKDEKEEMIAEKETKETPQTGIAALVDDNRADAGDGTDRIEEKKIDDPLENLVIISSRPRPLRATTLPEDVDNEIIDSVSLYRRMTPSTRILALPDYYVLRHSSASTLVSVSLVVFGALPLAYRSYIFSINYDWLVGSELVATSVVATVTYGIVSWRWRARTSQSKTVHEALGARVGARDEAALLLLKEGAIRSVVESIVQAKEENSKDNSSKPSTTTSSVALIDSIQWAKDFGILEDNTITDESKDAANTL